MAKAKVDVNVNVENLDLFQHLFDFAFELYEKTYFGQGDASDSFKSDFDEFCKTNVIEK